MAPSNRAQAKGFRLILHLDDDKTMTSGNMAIPEGSDVGQVVTACVIETAAKWERATWLVWSDGDRPAIIPTRRVQKLAVEYIDWVEPTPEAG